MDSGSLIAGVDGRALFFGRPDDSFGVGAFYYNLSDELEDSAFPSVNFRNEAGVEVYYACAVTRWFYVGADVQYIDPARGDNRRAVVAALRTQIRF